MTVWETLYVNGSSIQVLEGTVGTLRDAQDHHPHYYSGKMTAILGTEDEMVMQKIASTRGYWEILLPEGILRWYSRGYLLIGCLRYYGGLHSRRYDSAASVFVNDAPIDRVLLRIRPADQSDYFYEAPQPDVQLAAPFSDCRRLYAWPIISEHLASGVGHVMRVEVEIDRYANWDIDYVGLAYDTSRRFDAFLSYNSADRRVAQQLQSRLAKAGISVWMDQHQLGIGDPLITRIGSAIHETPHVIALLSSNSVNSPWVQFELNVAMNQEIHGRRTVVLPVLLDDCKIPEYLKGKVYADLRPAPRNYRQVVERITRTVRQLPHA